MLNLFKNFEIVNYIIINKINKLFNKKKKKKKKEKKKNDWYLLIKYKLLLKIQSKSWNK